MSPERPGTDPDSQMTPRPAEIVDEEEDGEKANKEAEQKEDFPGVNGQVEEGAGGEAADAPEEVEEVPDHSEGQEDFSGVNGQVEEGAGGEAADAPEEVEEVPDHSEGQAGPTRSNGGTDEENGEELDQVNTELQDAADKEVKSQGAGSGQDEADLDPQRPPRPEVKITSPQENENNEQNKDYAVVA